MLEFSVMTLKERNIRNLHNKKINILKNPANSGEKKVKLFSFLKIYFEKFETSN